MWCEYHPECGHTRKDCRELKKTLFDHLADQGKLNRYLKYPQEEKGKYKESRQGSDHTEGVVGVISRGMASGGLTRRPRKYHIYSLRHQVLEVETEPHHMPNNDFR